jgi:hypothetical protein
MYTLDPEIFATFVQQNATKLDATFLAKASCFMVKEVLGANSKELEADKSSDDLERAKKATNNINVLMEYFPDKLSRNSIGLEMEKDEQVNQSCDSDQLLEYFQVWLEKTQELHSFDAKSEFKSNSQEIDKSIQRAQEGSNFRFKLNEFMVDRAFFSREVNNKTVEFYLELYRGGVESCPAYYTQNWKKALLESMSSLDFVKLLKICKVEKNIPAYIKQYSLPMIQSKVISLDNNKDFGLIEKVFKENIIHEKEKRFYCPK